MTIASHLQELRRKHETLSVQVEKDQRSPGSDALKIAELKRQKLKLMDEIPRCAQASQLGRWRAPPAPHLR